MAYHSGSGAHSSKHRTAAAPDPPPLFSDTSDGYSSLTGGYSAPGADIAFSVNHLFGDRNCKMESSCDVLLPHRKTSMFLTSMSLLMTFFTYWLHVEMILSVLIRLLFGSDSYCVALVWTSSALMYFIVHFMWTAALGS
ncbi:hypothetical protein A6R68_09471 [Neotoma lepida]|uniref:Uncharacterized protein n=1 Tax=Neotoma lepida TaxID=56216 RepID=A0A1A6FZP1_NEOLE|nr:hypothetical protein A6R68_09471 [Neotoma lepida]